MKAKELAEILLTKPESDVCIKREYVINPHGDTDYYTKGIESISIKMGSLCYVKSKVYDKRRNCGSYKRNCKRRVILSS